MVLEKGPIDLSVFDRNLVDDDEALAKEVIVESGAYYKDTSDRQFNGTILGYVTPWNNHGYDVAKIWGAKFDLVSPVWLQILRVDEHKYEMKGTQDIDEGWMKDVRDVGNGKSKSEPSRLNLY